MKSSTVFCMIFGLTLVGCAGTTVVLVPDAAGKVGQVTVKTKIGEQTLRQSGESTSASDGNKAPKAPVILDKEEIQERFGSSLANEPDHPLHYAISFPAGSAELLPEAKPKIMMAYRAIEKRKSCDVSSIGHSDRAGDDLSNKELSLKRAEAVASVLKAIGLKSNCLDVRYYGENDPVVPTADGVAEARNRRVEIEIR